MPAPETKQSREDQELGLDSLPERPKPGTLARLDCCPKLEPDRSCSRLDFRYRLVQRVSVDLPNRGQQAVYVQVTVHAKLERCPGPLTLGDLAYSTTLLPGERVRLFTQDRRSRFTFDSTSNISYRHEQTAEEHYYMAAMNRYMSDLSIQEASQASAIAGTSWDTETDTPGILGTIFGGADVEVGGSHNAYSASEFLHELRQHAESSSHRSVEATRTANSVSVGEVSTRRHTEGESESHFEAGSRMFENPNRCHAVTYLFHRVNKTQTIRFTIVAIDRRIIDWAAPSKVAANPALVGRRLAVIPDAVRATEQRRLDVEDMTRESVRRQFASATTFPPMHVATLNQPTGPISSGSGAREPLDEDVRRRALALVDVGLVDAALIDREGGSIRKETQTELSFEVHTSLPTPGLVVKACLDECTACEPARHKEIILDLQRKILENRLLARRIELLEKSQEYRCCPEGSEELEEDDG